MLRLKNGKDALHAQTCILLDLGKHLVYIDIRKFLFFLVFRLIIRLEGIIGSHALIQMNVEIFDVDYCRNCLRLVQLQSSLLLIGFRLVRLDSSLANRHAHCLALLYQLHEQIFQSHGFLLVHLVIHVCPHFLQHPAALCFSNLRSYHPAEPGTVPRCSLPAARSHALALEDCGQTCSAHGLS